MSGLSVGSSPAGQASLIGDFAMQPKLIINWSNMSDPDFLMTSTSILTALADYSSYVSGTLPASVPNWPVAKATLDTYAAAVHAALTRDTNKIAERNQAREVLSDMLKRIAAFLEMDANGDVTKLAKTGFELRRDIQRGSTAGGDLPAPADFRVSHGARSGTLSLHVARLTGAGAYEIQIAQGDPTQEANWRPATTSKTGSHMTLDGLTPGQIYWLRVRGVGGPSGHGLWTQALNIMVI
jgi:hypothetical protein